MTFSNNSPAPRETVAIVGALQLAEDKEAQLMARFAQARAGEYAEFKERCDGFFAEVAKETERSKKVYAREARRRLESGARDCIRDTSSA